MATVACLPGYGGSTATRTPGSSTPRAIQRGRSRTDGRESTLVSSSPSGGLFDLGRGSVPGSLPRSSFETSRRASTSSASAPRSTTGFSPGSSTLSYRVSEPAARSSFSGLLSQEIRNADSPHPEAVLKAQLTANLSNERVSSYAGSSDWRAAKVRLAVLNSPYVQSAYAMAATAHAGQMRKDGSSVMRHLEETAIILADVGMDATVVAAALLHDSLDDTRMTRELLREFAPEDVAELVSSVSQVSTISQLFRNERSLDDDEATAEQLRGMILALGDVRVVLIKLADRLHNMRTLSALPPAKRERMAVETESLFVPLANRLGVWSLKAELEDLCLKARSPEGFQELEEHVNDVLRSQNESINTFLSDAHAQLKAQKVPVLDICGRPKNLASIYKKLQTPKGDNSGRTLHDIHDVRAVRIIVNKKEECYAALRAITARWPEVEGRHKNYIRHPKANGYQSLHTVVISDDGQPIEVQIRTHKMHWVAEYGIAAHWRYKEHKQQGSSSCAIADSHRVLWSRLMLAFSYGLNDKKCRVSGSPGRETFMNDINAPLFAAHRRSSAGAAAPLGVDDTSTSFHRYASTVAAAPAADESISIVVSTPEQSSIRTFPSAFATVRDALQWFPAGTRADDLVVNGDRVQRSFQELAIGDVVQLVPQAFPALQLPVHLPRVTPWPLLRGTSTGTCRAVLSHVMNHVLNDGSAFASARGAVPSPFQAGQQPPVVL